MSIHGEFLLRGVIHHRHAAYVEFHHAGRARLEFSVQFEQFAAHLSQGIRVAGFSVEEPAESEEPARNEASSFTGVHARRGPSAVRDQFQLQRNRHGLVEGHPLGLGLKPADLDAAAVFAGMSLKVCAA